MASPVDFPSDLVGFWDSEWCSGPESDGIESFFNRNFRFAEHGYVGSRMDTPWPNRERHQTSGGSITIWWIESFPSGYQYRVIDDNAKACATKIAQLVMVDEESGVERLYVYLIGMIGLKTAWRFDIVECFDGEPTREQLVAVSGAYFNGDYKPQILMQIDATSLERFYLLREQQ
ncbi:MAG: hypothetical protein ACRDAM_08420 [Casimicrobium sp.]